MCRGRSSSTEKAKRLGAACRLGALWLLALVVPAEAFGKDAAFVRSLVIPGAGQAHQGHYRKAALFAGLAIASGAGLFSTQIHYNQAVDRFDRAKDTQAGIEARLKNGEIVSIEEIDANYSDMVEAHDQADGRLVWRNVFLVTLISVYAANLVDVWISEPHDTETAQRYSIEVNRERVLLTRAFRF